MDTFAPWLEGLVDVRTAHSAGVALDVHESANVDVALLDRRTPVTSGDELLATLREREHDPRVATVSAVDPTPTSSPWRSTTPSASPSTARPSSAAARTCSRSQPTHLSTHPATNSPTVHEHRSLEAKLAMLEARDEDGRPDDQDALDALRECVAKARECATTALERDRFDDGASTGAC